MTTQCLLICLLEILPISCASVIEAALISSVLSGCALWPSIMTFSYEGTPKKVMMVLK